MRTPSALAASAWDKLANVAVVALLFLLLWALGMSQGDSNPLPGFALAAFLVFVVMARRRIVSVWRHRMGHRDG